MLIKNNVYQRLLRALGEGDPEVTGLLDKLLPYVLNNKEFANKDFQYYYLDPNKIYDQLNNLKLIRNWIKAAIANGEEWIRDHSYDDFPRRFLQIPNFDMLAEAMSRDNDIRRSNMKIIFERHARGRLSRDQLVDAGDIRIAHIFNNESCFVQLLTPEALDHDCYFMGHCIGLGSYDVNLSWPGYEYYSYWDRKNESHVTMEVIDGVVAQCKGKQNEPPVEKYLGHVLQFVRNNRWSVDRNPWETGMVNVSGTVALACLRR